MVLQKQVVNIEQAGMRECYESLATQPSSDLVYENACAYTNVDGK